ncbi:dienelactone hydrolase family protein [Halieaceae bacterium IMCC14734]|uniref:Dienelactone hydrolase family protein n=1 Tax=Candidatus Litorirhabdus singularis TaxID=2518993 RepID=A0ABT3THS5_9GAMM|nr:dienelactone hydrolase family protein [Candidatus Litorirhabdus singularis]MCX2981880.1 dienelactone hydrolase family protein [Candidatus Litorirhabdus singularis]
MPTVNSGAGSQVSYFSGDTELRGYFAAPEGVTNAPCVIVVHEWWGINDYIRRRVDMLAELGFCALAADMYGAGREALTPDDAGALMQGVLDDPTAVPQRFGAALEWLRGKSEVDAGRVAAIGYCFGGAVALAMARAGMDLAAVASFHGVLETATPAQPGQIKARIAVYHGNDDGMIPAEQVTAFDAEMKAAGADYEIIGYDGAGHGFSSPEADRNGELYGIPVAYNQAADADSWAKLQQLLAATLRR